VYTALLHNYTCRLEARQALIYQLVWGLTDENGKYNDSKAVHVYPPFFDITCSAENYKIASVLTVKLYNKSIERGLSGTKITRLELTIDPATPYQKIRWPQAYIIRTRQAQIDELRLTDTEQALLDGILVGAIDLTRLGRKTRLKLEQYMEDYVQWLAVSAANYRQVLNRVNSFLAFPCVDLQTGTIDFDELPKVSPSLPAWVWEAEKSHKEMLVI